MAGRVIGDFPFKIRVEISNFQNINQVLGKFICPIREKLSSFEPFWIIRKSLLIPMFDHSCTGARRYDNISWAIFKDLYGMFSHFPGFRSHPGIESRLAAASLTSWKPYVYPGLLKHLDNCLANLGVERINYASYKQLNILRHWMSISGSTGYLNKLH